MKHFNKRRQPSDTKADMTPMLDIVFILLLFFIVTTSFIQTDTLDVNQPSTVCEEDCNKDTQPLIVSIDGENQVSFNNRIIDLEAVQANLESELVNNIEAPVIVKIHSDAHNMSMVSAIDQAKRAGVSNVSVAQWR